MRKTLFDHLIRSKDLKIPKQYEEIEIISVRNLGDIEGVICGEKE